MSNEELIQDLEEVEFYHKICAQKCNQLKKKLAADSSAASKKKNSYEEFLSSDVCKNALAKRELLIQRKLKN